jgi:hypothetical protein
MPQSPVRAPHRAQESATGASGAVAVVSARSAAVLTACFAVVCSAVLIFSVGGAVAHADVDGEALRRATDLPSQARALRADGVAASQVRVALGAAKRHKLKAGEASALLGEWDRAVKDFGAMEQFGQFVKSKLDEGLLGDELYAAIRAEHEAHGSGLPVPATEDDPGKAPANPPHDGLMGEP